MSKGFETPDNESPGSLTIHGGRGLASDKKNMVQKIYLTLKVKYIYIVQTTKGFEPLTQARAEQHRSYIVTVHDEAQYIGKSSVYN